MTTELTKEQKAVKLEKLKRANKLFNFFAVVVIPSVLIISSILVAVFFYNQPPQIGLMAADDGKAMGAAIGAGLACIGMLGSGVGQGYAAGAAAQAVSRNPEAEAKIRSMMIVGAAIAESSALYCFVIAIMLIFVF